MGMRVCHRTWEIEVERGMGLGTARQVSKPANQIGTGVPPPSEFFISSRRGETGEVPAPSQRDRRVATAEGSAGEVWQPPGPNGRRGGHDLRIGSQRSRNWDLLSADASQSVLGRGLRADRDLLPDARILIIDDCTLDRENLAATFVAGGAATPGVAWDLSSLVTALEGGVAPIVLLSISTKDSLMLLQAALRISPDIRAIVLGVSEDDESTIVACAERGVAGYHMRDESLDDLLELIQKVAAGQFVCSPRVSAILLNRLSALASQRQPASTTEVVLTAREAQILRMLEMGLSNRDIAARLCIAVHTVKNHVHSVLTKLGVSNRAEAAARCRTLKISETGSEN
jgi:DNA-binding NarL/FixJ family response regulator